MQETGTKFDEGKVDLSLLPITPLEYIARVLEFGAKKYGATNWRKGMSWRRLAAACLRHIFAYLRGEDLDPESGLPHLAHAACCLIFLLWYGENRKNFDDRIKDPCFQEENAVD